MTSIYYYDGHRYSPDEAAIPFSDRSVFFGDAIYEACLVKDGRPYLFEQHLDRFFAGCRALEIRLKQSRNELCEIITELCKECGEGVAFLYFQASRGAPQRRHFFTDTDESHLLITLTEWKMRSMKDTLSLILEKDRRYEYCHLKTTNLLPAVLASAHARSAGADETVFVRDGLVTECAHSNISILINGILYTHPKGRHILPGIARERLIQSCEGLGIPVREHAFTPKELLCADEVFITSTTKLCLRASRLCAHSIGMKDEKCAFSILNDVFSHFNSI